MFQVRLLNPFFVKVLTFRVLGKKQKTLEIEGGPCTFSCTVCVGGPKRGTHPIQQKKKVFIRQEPKSYCQKVVACEGCTMSVPLLWNVTTVLLLSSFQYTQEKYWIPSELFGLLSSFPALERSQPVSSHQNTLTKLEKGELRRTQNAHYYIQWGEEQKKSFLPLENGLSKQQSTRKNGSSINFHSVTLPDGGYIIMKEEEKVQQLSDLGL